MVVFIDLIGFGIAIPILPILIEKTGGGAFMVGVAISVFSLFQFLFSPILGRLSDKYGRRNILIVTAFINSLSYFMIFFWQGIWFILLARIIAGIGSANISVAQAYVADTTKAHERTKAMALVGAAFGLGFIVGPLLGGLTSGQYGLNTPFLIPAVLSLLNTVLIFFILPESNKNLQKHIKIEIINWKVTREVLKPKNISFLLFLFFFINFALALVIGIFPLYSQEVFGWGEIENGYYFALIGLAGVITQTVIIRLMLKKFNEAKIVRIALLVFGAAVIGVGIAPNQFLTYAIGPMTSFGFSLINVNTQALISLESNENEQGIVLGVAQSFASLARVFGPLVGGILASFSLHLPYIVSGIMAILILVWGRNYLKFMNSTNKRKTTAATIE